MLNCLFDFVEWHSLKQRESRTISWATMPDTILHYLTFHFISFHAHVLQAVCRKLAADQEKKKQACSGQALLVLCQNYTAAILAPSTISIAPDIPFTFFIVNPCADCLVPCRDLCSSCILPDCHSQDEEEKESSTMVPIAWKLSHGIHRNSPIHTNTITGRVKSSFKWFKMHLTASNSFQVLWTASPCFTSIQTSLDVFDLMQICKNCMIMMI